ncbi:unnamed protein product [Ixodes pacificus]
MSTVLLLIASTLLLAESSLAQNCTDAGHVCLPSLLCPSANRQDFPGCEPGVCCEELMNTCAEVGGECIPMFQTCAGLTQFTRGCPLLKKCCVPQ